MINVRAPCCVVGGHRGEWDPAAELSFHRHTVCAIGFRAAEAILSGDIDRLVPTQRL